MWSSRLIGSVAFLIDHRARRVALSNLAAAFGDRYQEIERRNIAKESFQHFARTMLELLWSQRLNAQTFPHYVEVVNAEPVYRAGSQFIMAVYHYSNWEWLGLAPGYRGIVGTVITQEFKNSLLDPIFTGIRERAGHEFVPTHRGLLRLYKALRRNKGVALLVDLTLPPREGSVVIERFGLKTSVPAAHAWLHKQTGAPIFPVHAEPLPGGRYRVVFHPVIKDMRESTEQEIAQACWNSFEPYVKRNPAPWLWMYKHWRYKPSVTTREYPFYAQTLPRFDALAALGNRPAPVIAED